MSLNHLFITLTNRLIVTTIALGQNVNIIVRIQAVGTITGLLYFKLLGYRFSRFQFLSVIIPTLIITALFAKTGIMPPQLFNDISMLAALTLIISTAYERNKKGKQQHEAKQS